MHHSLRILLLQARHDGDPCRAEEVDSFATRCGIERSQITAWDLLSAAPSVAEARDHDAVMVGGNGEFHVSKGHLPHQERLFDFLRELAAVGHPTFASCFGFQCLVSVGPDLCVGTVVHDLVAAGPVPADPPSPS